MQAERCLEIVATALSEAGAAAVGKVHGRVFAAVRPATGFIVVSGFIDPRWKVEIDADAVVGG